MRLEFRDEESVFFLAESSLDRASILLDAELKWRAAPVRMRCFAPPQEPAVACYFRNQRDLGLARKLLDRHGIPMFEADIRPPDRFLMERFIRGTLEVTGDAEADDGCLCFYNPRIRPSPYDPGLSVVSLDIETSVSRNLLLSIAIHGDGLRRVFMLGEAAPTALEYLEFVEEEQTLIARFLSWFAECDPDVVIGWNIVGFDLKFLQERCDALGLSFSLGRGRAPVSWRFVERGQRTFALVPGRVVLDGIELLRTATYSFESFSLERVARELLGRGKLVDDVDARAREIEDMHRRDREALARYNLEDCALVSDIFRQTGLIDFAIRRACLTGLEMDRQGGSVAAFDFLYLPRLHRSGFVAPVVDAASIVHSPGGHVLESRPGIYNDVIVLDFKSLYPSIIRTFHVDPLAMIARDESRIPGFLDASFSRDRFILPRIIEELWQAREQARQAQDAAASQAIKIIMNSFYGVLGTPGCRFFDPRLASSITLRGHEILQRTRDLIEAKGLSVIYGDTDSVFVLMDGQCDDVRRTGCELADYLNDWWRKELWQSLATPSYLEIEFETHFLKFFMPTVRGSDKGSKKRYAGLAHSPGKSPALVFKGLESVRSDWSPLAREFQQELYRRVFMDEPLKPYVKETVRRLLEGGLDDRLILRKRLRRKLSDYRKNIPPHVRAARLADAQRVKKGLPPLYEQGGWIEYTVTVKGPEPTGHTVSPVDYNFYIDRQLAPIADAILGFRGTSLAEMTDRQLDLF